MAELQFSRLLGFQLLKKTVFILRTTRKDLGYSQAGPKTILPLTKYVCSVFIRTNLEGKNSEIQMTKIPLFRQEDSSQWVKIYLK